MKITSAGAATGFVFSACGHKEEKLIPLLVADQEIIPGVDYWKTSACQQCSAGCGITVRLIEGKAKKIEGNPLHPLNQGRLCARGQAGLQVLYNPDRIRSPLKLNGQRGSGQYQQISWDEALKMVTEKLKELRVRNEAHTLLFLTAPLSGHTRILVERFMQAYGSPNLFIHELFSDEAVRKANLLSMGYDRFASYDLENANYLISFGAAFLETSRSVVRNSLGFAHSRQGRPGVRSKFVQVEPRFSLTAASADEFIAVRPGTEGALALALAHVIIKENLYDKDFVSNSTAGFDEWKAAVLNDYSPEKVSTITGAPQRTIERIAREFARFGPSLAIGGDAAAAHTNGLSNMLAINALNALVGSIGRKGGLFFAPSPPLSPLPKASGESDRRAGSTGTGASGSSTFPSLLQSITLSGLSKRRPINAAIIYNTNPAFSLPEPAQVREFLSQIPFIVSLASFMDETASMADLILPAHTYLEGWQDSIPEIGTGAPMITLGQPVVKPLYNTRAAQDVLFGLAKEIGGPPAESLPWATFLDMLKTSYQGLYRQKRGSVVADDFNRFWDEVVKRGGWWDSEFRQQFQFGTPSKRYEFSPLQENGRVVVMTAPKFEGEEAQFPFHLHIYQSIALGDGRGANLPWLQELPDPMTTVMWNSWVEINPGTAQKLSIREGDLVWVESTRGRIKLPALIYPGAAPDVVNIPVGQGHKEYGSYAKGRGANPIEIIAPLAEPVSGALAWAATRVKIYKSGEAARLAKFGTDIREHSQQSIRR